MYSIYYSQNQIDFGGDEVFANALENRLTILSSAPTIQKETGNAPFVNTSVFGDGNIQEHVWNFRNLVVLPILQVTTQCMGYGGHCCHT